MIKSEDTTMTKKNYIQPEISVSRIETTTIICTSMPKGGGGDPLDEGI